MVLKLVPFVRRHRRIHRFSNNAIQGRVDAQARRPAAPHATVLATTLAMSTQCDYHGPTQNMPGDGRDWFLPFSFFLSRSISCGTCGSSDKNFGNNF